jgi:ABC-2 type transport system permease protein
MMPATLVLVRHSLTRSRGLMIGLGVMLGAFQFLLTQVAVYLMRQNAFSQLSLLIPDFVRTAAGPSALAFMSFGGIIGLGYFHPVVITALTGLMIAIATEPAAEVEMRFVDFTLARPIARRTIVVRTLIVLAIAGMAALALMIAGTWIGLTCCTPLDAERPSFSVILSLAVDLASIMGCWAGVTLAIAAGVRRRAVGAAVAGACALGAYLLDYLGRAWQPAAAISTLSPFHYFEPMVVIMGGTISLPNIAVLAAIGTSGALVGLWVFSRRDI